MTEKEFRDLITIAALRRAQYTAGRIDAMPTLNMAGWVVSYCDNVEKLFETIRILLEAADKFDQIKERLEQ